MIPKFKVWDKQNKCWANDFTISLNGELLCDNGTTLFIKDNFEVVQWTGLTDIDDMELYIGDIIKFADEATNDYLLQVFALEHLGFEFRWLNDNRLLIEREWLERFKIIGNIYQKLIY